MARILSIVSPSIIMRRVVQLVSDNLILSIDQHKYCILELILIYNNIIVNYCTIRTDSLQQFLRENNRGKIIVSC